MGIPETIWVILVAMVGGLHLQSHGERRTDRWNIFLLLATLMPVIGLFYWGGLWDSDESQARVARLVLVALYGCDTGLHLWNHGKRRKDSWNFFGFLFSASLSAALLYWGGFFS
jgi:hypothetical protein